MNNWIKIKKLGDMPKDGQRVIIATRNGFVGEAAFRYATQAFEHSCLGATQLDEYKGKVTHWMPLPELP